MRKGLFFGIVIAIVLHSGFILFGGTLFASHKKDYGTLKEVELVSDNVESQKEKEKEKEKPKEQTEEKKQEMEAETEQAPDTDEIVRNIELAAAASTPKLDAASLSEIESALSGQVGGGGDFTEALSFASGGRIGGTGKAGVLEQNFEKAFSLSEMDQRPQVIYQAVPVYPSSMHSVLGSVTVIFVVDSNGKVVNPRVEKSSHHEFEKPAIDAVKQWKFEPGVKAGKRVSCKMRVPITFQPR
jgi:TonB family protein